jgi:hypothetical protein
LRHADADADGNSGPYAESDGRRQPGDWRRHPDPHARTDRHPRADVHACADVNPEARHVGWRLVERLAHRRQQYDDHRR